jgi:hypothetical protein
MQLTHKQTRTPVWKPSDEKGFSKWRKDWEERYGLWVAMPLFALSVFLFVGRLTPLLSDRVLFFLKLVSFILTATFGFVGVVTDFKDEKKRLTKLGKLNLTGLILAAIIGLISQNAENQNAIAASETQKNKFRELTEKNEKTLQQVKRGLEPLGDTLNIEYYITLKPTADSTYNQVARDITAKGEAVLKTQDEYNDAHTQIFRDLHGKGLHIIFDNQSDILTTYPVVGKTSAAAVPFEIEIYQYNPQNILKEKIDPQFRPILCNDFSKAGLLSVYKWDRELSKSRPVNHSLYRWLDNPMVSYDQTKAEFNESSNQGVVFRINERHVHVFSVFDLQGKFLLVRPGFGEPFSFYRPMLITIGQRVIALRVNDVAPDTCGNIVIQIPQFLD